MMDDKAPQLARASVEPKWDELRERRVLDAVLRQTRKAAPARLPWLVAATAVACSAALVLWFTHRPGPSENPLEDHQLLDGSRLTYGPDADVQVLEQHQAAVSVRQGAGRVRYQVKHDPDRRFTVRVGAVEVLVVGTSFVVDAGGGRVSVHVEHGHVQVHDGRREVDLSDGEEVQMTTTPTVAPPTEAPPPVEGGDPVPRPVDAPPGDSAGAVQRLLGQADRARSAGNLPQAVTALSAVVNRYPQDPRAVSAWFTLGRVEGQLGRAADAARAFASCRARAPNGPLAEDALAEEAAAWQKAGQPDRASTAARRYLELYPAGANAPRLRPLVE